MFMSQFKFRKMKTNSVYKHELIFFLSFREQQQQQLKKTHICRAKCNYKIVGSLVEPRFDIHFEYIGARGNQQYFD